MTKLQSYRYLSPLRPMPLFPAGQQPPIAWDDTEIGEWTPKKVYAYLTPISDELVQQWDLVLIEGGAS